MKKIQRSWLALSVTDGAAARANIPWVWIGVYDRSYVYLWQTALPLGLSYNHDQKQNKKLALLVGCATVVADGAAVREDTPWVWTAVYDRSCVYLWQAAMLFTLSYNYEHGERPALLVGAAIYLRMMLPSGRIHRGFGSPTTIVVAGIFVRWRCRLAFN